MILSSRTLSPTLPAFWYSMRGLGIVYLIAFSSLWVQVDGLIGSRGILPAPIRFSSLFPHVSFTELPSLLLFIPSDLGLHILCAMGCASAIFLILDYLSPIASICAWILYLSLIHAGQVFMGFQWDVLLVEYGFLAIWICCWLIKPNHECIASKVLSKLLELSVIILIFKLIFSSGVVKIFGGGSWLNLTALQYHFFTQPIPGPLSHWFHQLPKPLLSFACATTFYLELLVPLTILIPSRPLRHVAALQLITLQILFILSGNFAFFNLLSIVLIIPLLSIKSFRLDKYLKLTTYPLTAVNKCLFFSVSAILVIIILFNLKAIWITCQFGNLLPTSISKRVGKLLDHQETYHQKVRPFLLVNSYGLFARMTTHRPEIQIQASMDGKIWKDYEFKYKLNNENEVLRQVAPHQPRLDWQMWFSALNGKFPQSGWMPNFILRLLQGEKSVTKLLRSVPFQKKPRFVRALIFHYEFESKINGNGKWKKTKRAVFLNPVQLSE